MARLPGNLTVDASRRRWSFSVLGVFAVLAATSQGCIDGDSTVIVSVTALTGEISGVAQFRVSLKGAAMVDELHYPRSPTASLTLTPSRPVTFSVTFAGSLSGKLEVCVTPLNAAGAVLGAGYGEVPIRPERLANLGVIVEPNGNGACGGGPASDGGGTDGGRGDGSTSPDGQDWSLLTCNPVAAGDCTPSQTCSLTCEPGGAARTQCVASGATMPGAICVNDSDCVSGSQCFMDVCGVRTCRRFCDEKTPCPGSGKCVTPVACSDTQPSTGVRICSQPCDPTGDGKSGCAQGLRCFIFPDEVVDCDCADAARKGTDGVACTDTGDCAPGHICVNMAGKATVCRPVCLLSSPVCTIVGRTCEMLVMPTYKTYGACLPP